ncbi:MAG: [Fe-S]-binding protein [Legionella sp. 21-45-4]|nr:MAG: [Fe-S]-binding protein [Legionella sp. 21-45-4]
MTRTQEIDALLPQTQCGECGYPGCLPYAEALNAGVAPINRCPPGGPATILALAHFLRLDPSPYLEDPLFKPRAPATAQIIASECIGCTKCIQACPVDAIIGSAKLMHTILAHECTGCGLCVDPCPVDCIEILPLETPQFDARHHQKKVRALREEHEKAETYNAKRQLQASHQPQQDKAAKQAYILQALSRAEQKHAKKKTT